MNNICNETVHVVGIGRLLFGLREILLIESSILYSLASTKVYMRDNWTIAVDVSDGGGLLTARSCSIMRIMLIMLTLR